MAKSNAKPAEKRKVAVSFSAPRELIEAFDKEIEYMKEESQFNFTRSGFIQVLILRFLISKEEARKAANDELKQENKNLKED